MLIGRVIEFRANFGKAEFTPEVRRTDLIYYRTPKGKKVMCQVTGVHSTSQKGFHGTFVVLDAAAELPRIWDNLYLAHQRMQGHIEVGVTDNREEPVKLRVNPFFRHVLAAGKTHSGKTHLQIVLQEEFLKHQIPSIVIDTQGEFIHINKFNEDAIIVEDIGFNELLSYLQSKKTVVLNLQGLPYTSKAQRCYELLSQLKEAKEKDYQQANSDVRFLRLPPVLINIDEAEIYVHTKRKSASKECIIDIAKRGGKLGLGLILSSQRLPALHYDARSQCNTAIIFHITDSGSRTVLSNFPYISALDLKCVRNLPRGHCIITGDMVPQPILVQIRDIKTHRAKDLDFEKMLGLTPIPTEQEVEVTEDELKEFQTMVEKGITFQQLQSKFPIRNIHPHGECLVIPERFFKQGWTSTLEAQGYKVVHCPDMPGGSVYLVRKNNSKTLREIKRIASTHLPRDSAARRYKD